MKKSLLLLTTCLLACQVAAQTTETFTDATLSELAKWYCSARWDFPDNG